jgi:cytidylate kinase
MTDPCRPHPIVAIDGPAGAGKSTVARRLAEVLGFVYVDTGALYRGVALAAERHRVDWRDGEAVGALARGLVARRALSFARDPDHGVRVWLDGEDVTSAIREPEMAMGASTVSAHKAVRDALLDLQRHAGQNGAVVLEGRDIGTVVFPDADVKFFLTARDEVRAKRRHLEQTAKGAALSFEETLADVRRRDAQDSSRPVAPLRQAEDAVYIDNSDISVEETVSRMAREVRSRSSR